MKEGEIQIFSKILYGYYLCTLVFLDPEHVTILKTFNDLGEIIFFWKIIYRLIIYFLIQFFFVVYFTTVVPLYMRVGKTQPVIFRHN